MLHINLWQLFQFCLWCVTWQLFQFFLSFLLCLLCVTFFYLESILSRQYTNISAIENLVCCIWLFENIQKAMANANANARCWWMAYHIDVCMQALVNMSISKIARSNVEPVQMNFQNCCFLNAKSVLKSYIFECIEYDYKMRTLNSLKLLPLATLI